MLASEPSAVCDSEIASLALRAATVKPLIWGGGAVGNCEAGGVVFRAVDTQAGRQTLQCSGQRVLRAIQIVLGRQRVDVAINDRRHLVLVGRRPSS